MKKNEIIELGGVEYTLELNRDSFLQIDKICNIDETMELLHRGLYDYVDEIDDNYNPLADIPSDEDIAEEVKIKNKVLEKLVTRAFFIWLYPNHKLPISKVSELLKPLLEDEDKSTELAEKVGTYLRECVEIRQEYNKEKNLKPQANK